MLTFWQQHMGAGWRRVVRATLLSVLASGAGADDLRPASPEGTALSGNDDSQRVLPSAPSPVYQPMFPDAALSRVGSVTRGGVGAQDMMVLAPNRKGASATDQPTLFWFLPVSGEQSLEVVIQQRNADQPLLELQLKSVPGQQIGALALADRGIRLRPGVEYEWSVALVTDPERRSHDVFSLGTVQHVPPDPSLSASLQRVSGAERVRLLLDKGYWYDALQLLQAAESGDEVMAEWQRGLLRGEGLLAASGVDQPGE